MTQFSAHDPVVILSGARTPIGALQGRLASLSAPDLGAIAVAAAVERALMPAEAIERIYMGCVLSAGLGQAPARQAALKAGLPRSIEATTVNKMCGSGMQAVIMGAEAIAAGSVDTVIAGGMESMTNAPYLLKKHRGGARLGHDTAYDHMFLDGLEDAYEPGRAMGSFAQESADEYCLTRKAQDAFAITSLTRAQQATASGDFSAEIAPVTVTTRSGAILVSTDEQPERGRAERIATLKPAFAEHGTITAANASSISDGAAALVLTRQSVAAARELSPMARIVAMAGHAQEPSRFATAPVAAIRKVLDKAGWTVGDVDLFEVNEAFACVTMFAMQDLGIGHEKMNVHGGATALGHPIGASGARILITLAFALAARGEKRGVAALCIGGGEATAIAIERA